MRRASACCGCRSNGSTIRRSRPGRGGLERIEAFEPVRHQPLDAQGRPAPGPQGYVDNFLFVPPERVERLEAAAGALARCRIEPRQDRL
jgi:hypothetical protein